MSIKSSCSNQKNSSAISESFDLNFKQIEQTNQILNNIEGKLNSFFKKKKKIDNSFETNSNAFRSQKQSPSPIQNKENFNKENFESSFIKKTQTKKNLFSNALIMESLNNKFEEKDELQRTEEKLQEDLGSLKERLNSIQTKIPLNVEENNENSFKERRSFKLQSFKEKNEDISSNYYQEKIKLLEEKNEIVNKELNNIKEEKRDLFEESEKLKEMLALINRNHSEELRRLYNQNSDLIKDLETLKSEKTLLQMKLAENESNLNILQEEMRVLENKYQNKIAENNEEQAKAETHAKSMQEEIKTLESKYKTALNISNNEHVITKEENINGDLFKMLGSYQEELERIKMTNKGVSEHFKSEMNKLQSQLQSQKVENANIKEELSRIKNNKNENENKFIQEKNINQYTKSLEQNYNELEVQHKEQIEKNDEMKRILGKLTHKNREDFKNFNDLYQDIYGGKESDILLKKKEKTENNSFVKDLNERNKSKNTRNVSRGRDKSKKEKEGKINKSTSKTQLMKSESTSSDKENNKLDKCHKEIKRLKDLVNEKITLKKKEKPKKKKK